MSSIKSRNFKYFDITSKDELWGIVVTTIGCQSIPPQTDYPPLLHPDSYFFEPIQGRILREYQLLYIIEGKGYFESTSCKKIKISSGCIILLFPDEWHTYYPDIASGWSEYWVGFKGPHIDKRVENNFFSPQNPVFRIGISKTIIGCYEDIINIAIEQKPSYQQLISSIVLYILGNVYYKNTNSDSKKSFAADKISEAKIIMKQEIERPRSPVEIASQIGVSYSWFRQSFKKHTDMSPGQYQLYLKFLLAKELLERTTLTVSEISYRLGFENVAQFSAFFRKRANTTPTQYRRENKLPYKSAKGTEQKP